MDTLKHLSKQLEQCFATRSQVILHPGSDTNIFIGLDTVTQTSQYYWDGLKRLVTPGHPFLVFQYTLDGWGCYSEGNTVYKVSPKTAFSAIIPSEHVYYLPPDSQNWTFFYLIFNHPYIIRRIDQQKKLYGAVINVEPDQFLIVQAFKIFESVCTGIYRDIFTQEQALFNFLIEYDRHIYRLNQGNNFRESLLEEVRNYVANNFDKPISVMEIAKKRGMSRSRFSHYFNEITGLTPAQFIQSVRIEEAAHRLLESEYKIETIAAALGFTNSTHFCKVFKQNFHLSPGEFRRQMR